MDIRRAWRERQQQADRRVELRVTVLSSFTAEPLVPYLGDALSRAGLEADVRVGPYGQIEQQCLDPRSGTAEAHPDVVVIWPRLEDLWSAKPLPMIDEPEEYLGELDGVVASALAVREWGATLLFVLPAIPEVRPLGVGDAANDRGVFAVATAAREGARRRLAAVPGVLVADADEMIRSLGVKAALDWRRDVLARIPYREELFASIGERLARLVAISRQGAKKVIAVDADNTLWGGVVGEEGTLGVDLADNGPGEAYRRFQSYLLELRRAGAIIVLASKNNEVDVWPVFERPEMRLRRADLAAWRVNWEPKSSSIVDMADELNLGSDRFVLIDDSPLECAHVADALPEVQAVQMPADPALWYEAISASGLLDRLPPTKADLTRADSYRQETERRTLRERSTLDDFLASLELRVEIADIDELTVPRAAQLVAKTSQFTLAGHRHTDAEFLSYIGHPRYRARVVQAADRFGDYGNIGVFVVDLEPDQPGLGGPLLDTFTLSCRAMGRGVEVAMLAAALEIAEGQLYVVVHDGPKNTPARRFFAEHGWTRVGEPAALGTVCWPAHVTPLSAKAPASA